MTSCRIALFALLFISPCLALPTHARNISPRQTGMAAPVPSSSMALSWESALAPNLLIAQSGGWPPYPTSGGQHDIVRGPGGYFSWIKMILIIAVFLVWVRLTDGLNRDALRFSEHTGQAAEVWNPIILICFMAGLIAVLSIPQFLAGYPVYVALALLPWAIYQLQRRGQIPEEAVTGQLFSKDVAIASAPITIKAAGKTSEQSQGNLIRARQSEAFELATHLLHESVCNRVEQVLLDYTKDSVTQRIQVDGLWHQMPPMDRESGDGLLWVLKTIANLNSGERRQLQRGVFGAKVGREKVEFEMTSQGVKTGERVLLKLIRESTLKLELSELGMLPDMQQFLMEKIADTGIVIVSAPPGQGLSSTWQAMLNDADRFTRDFVGVADLDDRETERENIEIKRIDSSAGQTPADLLPGMILKQPHAFVMSRIADLKTMDLLTEQATTEDRTVITRVNAASANEALLRMLAIAGNRERFAKGVTAVICQRLVRRLCDQCKKPFQANPQAIQQMGGDPRVQQVLYKDYQLPPLEQRVDAQGKPVQMEPCPACTGIGFVGRIAIYEMLLVDQPTREALIKSPKLEVLNQVARQQGNLNLLQQAYRAVLEGKTSMPEVQRVFQVRK